nr:hypothetical protein [Candidatus Ozemobacteraceae bacterium]
MRNRVTGMLMIAAFLLMSAQAFALSVASSKALDAFRRYEPDFVNALHRLQEMDRKAANQKLDVKGDAFAAIKDEADETMEFVQKRYDLLEDLFKTVSGDYPADRANLLDGFQRIDDLYRKVRDFHMTRFQERTSTPAVDTGKTEYEADVAPALKGTEPAKTEPAAKKTTPEPEKVRVTGTLKLEARNRNEHYTDADTALPNNLSQAKLSLMYERDAKNKLVLDEKMLQRRRNELVKENILALSWLHQHSKNTAVTVKDTLHHVWYPDADLKSYRDNLAEAFWNSKQGKYEYLMNLGVDGRVYPRYSRSDFTQLNYNSQTTYFVPNGT